MHVNELHIHTGNKINDVNISLEGLEVSLDPVRHFELLEFIGLGSEFKVMYQPGDPETDVNKL